jgi:hypothetical protein
MGEQLLKHLCASDDQKWEQAVSAAKKALFERISLWNGLTLHIVDSKKSKRESHNVR